MTDMVAIIFLAFFSHWSLGLALQSSSNDYDPQWLTFYEHPEYQGDSRTIERDFQDLSIWLFSDMASSCCLNGMWIIYADAEFNQGNLDAMNIYAFGNNTCFNFPEFFDNAATSARLVGAPQNYKMESLHLYQAEKFNGLYQYTYFDTSSSGSYFNKFGSSMILTGCKPWTIYKDEKFQGDCACTPQPDPEKCDPVVFPSADSMKGFAQNILSVKLGCFCDTQIEAP